MSILMTSTRLTPSCPEHIIERSYWHLEFSAALFLNDETTASRICNPSIEFQAAEGAPRSLWYDDYSFLSDLIVEIPANTFHIDWIGLDHDHFAGAMPESIIAKGANVRANVDHNIPRRT